MEEMEKSLFNMIKGILIMRQRIKELEEENKDLKTSVDFLKYVIELASEKEALNNKNK